MKIINYFTTIAISLLLLSCSSTETKLFGTLKNTAIDIKEIDGSDVSPEKVAEKKQLIESLLAKEISYEFSSGDNLSLFKLSTNEKSISGDFQVLETNGDIEVACYEGKDINSIPISFTITELTDSKLVTLVINNGMKVIYTYTKQ